MWLAATGGVEVSTNERFQECDNGDSTSWIQELRGLCDQLEVSVESLYTDHDVLDEDDKFTSLIAHIDELAKFLSQLDVQDRHQLVDLIHHLSKHVKMLEVTALERRDCAKAARQRQFSNGTGSILNL